LWTEGQTLRSERMTAPIVVPTLAGVWRDLETTKNPTWCLIAAVALPGLLESYEPILAAGLESLESQQWLIRDSAGLKAAPKLRALVRSLQSPMAHASLEVSQYEREQRTVRGFTGVRTGRKLWIWEAVESGDVKKPYEKPSVNVFQVTHRQFTAILKRFLNFGAAGVKARP